MFISGNLIVSLYDNFLKLFSSLINGIRGFKVVLKTR